MGPTRVTAAVTTPSHPLQIPQNRIHAETKNRPTQRANIISQSGPLFLRQNLRLRWLSYFGSEEHRPNTRESSSNEIDRSRPTLRNRQAIPPTRIAFTTAVAVAVSVSKSSRSQATHHNDRQPPFSPNSIHAVLPVHLTRSEPALVGESRGTAASWGSSSPLHIETPSRTCCQDDSFCDSCTKMQHQETRPGWLKRDPGRDATESE
jgi:hypothetical protein